VRDLAKRCRQAEATSSRSVAEKKIFLGKIRRGMTDGKKLLTGVSYDISNFYYPDNEHIRV